MRRSRKRWKERKLSSLIAEVSVNYLFIVWMNKRHYFSTVTHFSLHWWVAGLEKTRSLSTPRNQSSAIDNNVFISSKLLKLIRIHVFFFALPCWLTFNRLRCCFSPAFTLVQTRIIARYLFQNSDSVIVSGDGIFHIRRCIVAARTMILINDLNRKYFVANENEPEKIWGNVKMIVDEEKVKCTHSTCVMCMVTMELILLFSIITLWNKWFFF